MSQITPGLTSLAQQTENVSSASDFQQAALTAFFTVVTGVLVYLIKTGIDEYWLSHLREYRKLKADIAFYLVKYANAYSNAEILDRETTKEVADALREQAARVSAFIETRPLICWGVPQNERLKEASSSLIGLSNGTYATNKQVYDSVEFMDRQVQKIKKLLKLKSIQ